jgi:general secretion pathway protein K
MQKGDAMKRSDPRRGVILLTVLWSIALLSALAMAASVTFRGFAGIMAVERDRLQGDALLSAGLETAAGILDSLGDASLLDIETSINLTTGSVRLRLNDEGGRVDIGKAPAIVLAALLRSVGANEAAANDIAQRIVEQRNAGNRARPDTTPGSATGATGMPGGDQQPFSDVRQLQLVPGMSPDWVAALAPLATVFGSEAVNPLTAPPGVIAALPGVDKGQADAFLKARGSFPADSDRLVRMLGAAQQYLAVKPQRVASVELLAKLPSGYAVAARSVIVALPQDSQPYRVLVWTPLPYPRLFQRSSESQGRSHVYRRDMETMDRNSCFAVSGVA